VTLVTDNTDYPFSGQVTVNSPKLTIVPKKASCVYAQAGLLTRVNPVLFCSPGHPRLDSHQATGKILHPNRLFNILGLLKRYPTSGRSHRIRGRNSKIWVAIVFSITRQEEVMKKILLSIVVSGLLTACSQKAESIKLEPGTPAYAMAEKLAARIPYLDPEQNNPLVRCKSFDIRTGDLADYVARFYATRLANIDQVPDSELTKYVRETANQLANLKLYLTAAVKSDISISPAELDSVINIYVETAGGEEAYRKRLAQAQQSPEDIRELTRKNLTCRRFAEEMIRDEATVSEDEILEKYLAIKYVNLRHILLSTKDKSEEEKADLRRQMQDILTQAHNGADFKELARQFSDDPESKEKGGAMTGVRRGKLAPEFEAAAFSVLPGKISDIVETEFGYHIIKVERRQRETRPLQDLRKVYEGEIKQRKGREAERALHERLLAEEDYTEIEFGKTGS
jgi:parvulin-like peptidyl-prolyl isomerase